MVGQGAATETLLGLRSGLLTQEFDPQNAFQTYVDLIRSKGRLPFKLVQNLKSIHGPRLNIDSDNLDSEFQGLTDPAIKPVL